MFPFPLFDFQLFLDEPDHVRTSGIHEILVSEGGGI